MTDLDKSGHGFQRVRTYLGPSLGWAEEYVQPTTEIKTGGTYVVAPGDSVILVNVAAGVVIRLPDVRDWVQQTANQPATGFDRSITVKDFGGNANNFNIVIAPFGQQAIDNIQQSVVLSVARSVIKLIPLNDQTGWISEVASVTGGGSGGGDVFKAGNNTFTGVNTFQSTVTAPTPLAADDSANVATTNWVQNKNYITNAAATLAFQPLDADLTAIASFTATDTMIYRSGTNAWAQVVIGSNMTFAGGVLSSTGGGGGGAPIGAQYVVSALDGTLTNERLLTDSASVVWDFSVPGVVKANSAAGGGNVSTSGTPTVNQLAQWVTSTTIKGIDIATLGFQPLDGDLTALSGLTGTNTIYYRSATDIWSPVTYAGLSFSGGVLSVTAGGGNVNNVGTPTVGQFARWTDPTHIEGVALTTISATAPATPFSGAHWYDLNTGVFSIYIDDGNSSQWVQIGPPSGGGGSVVSTVTGYVGPPQGRLTLTAATPVMTASVAAANTVYYVPYLGDKIPIFDGTSFVMTTIPAGLSVLTTNTANSPAAIGISKVNDWYVWNDAGTIRLTHGPDWTSDSARPTTAPVMLAGILVNNLAITNGPGINRGTYVATTRSNGTSTIDWILGGIAVGGTAGFLGVWNMYNRTEARVYTGDSNTATYAIPSPGWGSRAAMRVSFVCGQAEEAFEAVNNAIMQGGANYVSCGVGYDVTTAFSGSTGYAGANTIVSQRAAFFGTIPAPGFHFAAAIEVASAAGSIAYGNAGVPANIQSGFHFKMRM